MRKAVPAVLLVLGLAGCAPDYVTGNSSPVNLYVAAVNGGRPLQSSVRFPVEPDVINVTIAIRTKNPNVDITQRVAMAVFVERYEVRYFRSDGRNTEGVDVPFRISGNLATVEDVENTGGLDVPVEVVRAQAKVEPPLTRLRGATFSDLNNGVTTSGQAFVLTCFAEITLHGRTTAGQAVSGSGRMQIDFADWP